MAALTVGYVSHMSVENEMPLKFWGAHIHHDRPVGVIGQGLSTAPLILARHRLLPFLHEERHVLDVALLEGHDFAHGNDISVRG